MTSNYDKKEAGQMTIFDNIKDIDVVVEIEGMPELQKLLNLALEQVEQLEKTVAQLNKIKLRVVRPDIQKRRRETLGTKK